MNKLVALLPMKANSERVPGKNFKKLGDKPLVSWILDTLVSLPEIDLVVINTDARDILRENGVQTGGKVLIRDRREEICGDFVSMNKILEDDIENVPSKSYLMTHTTNPFIKPQTIKSAVQKYHDAENCDSLFSVNKWQTRFYLEDGKALNHDPDNLIRTQDLEPWYEENSCLYIFSQKSFVQTKARIGKKPVMFETPRLESVDIDGPDDWAMAEALSPLHQS